MKRYDEIMDHIKVTDDMRSRIFENIEAGDIAAERRRKQTGRTMTKLLSLAACLAVIIIAASALRSPAQVSTSDDLQPNGGGTLPALFRAVQILLSLIPRMRCPPMSDLRWMILTCRLRPNRRNIYPTGTSLPK